MEKSAGAKITIYNGRFIIEETRVKVYTKRYSYKNKESALRRFNEIMEKSKNETTTITK